MGCCSPYDDVFSGDQARKDLRRYRRRGLARDARAALAFLRSRGLGGATLLEVGGGIGALQLEALRSGAGRAVNVELSQGYERVAAELLAEAGLADRVERRMGDVVQEPPEPADAVAMVRVVCCYPDPERLVGAVAARARRALVITYPPDNVLARAFVVAENLRMRLKGSDFRAYAHRHERLHAAAGRAGLRLAYRRRGLVWQVAGYERPAD